MPHVTTNKSAQGAASALSASIDPEATVQPDGSAWFAPPAVPAALAAAAPSRGTQSSSKTASWTPPSPRAPAAPPKPDLPRKAPRASFDIARLEPHHFERVTAYFKPGAGVHPVVFLEIAGGGFLVLKADKDVENEFHTSELFRKEVPVAKVPRMRLLRKDAYRRQLERLHARFAIPGFDALIAQIRNERPEHFLVAEYLDGCTTIGAAGRWMFAGKAGQARLFVLGMVAAYDLVIENNDRFPGVISEGFNSANFLFQREVIEFEIPEASEAVPEELVGKLVQRTIQRPVAIDNNVAQLRREDIEMMAKDRGPAPGRQLTFAHFLEEVMNDQDVAKDIARNMARRIHSGRADAADIIADGIREGLLRLTEQNKDALRDLRKKMCDVDPTREAIVSRSIEELTRTHDNFRRWRFLWTDKFTRKQVDDRLRALGRAARSRLRPPIGEDDSTVVT